jgi:hypothetical protein
VWLHPSARHALDVADRAVAAFGSPIRQCQWHLLWMAVGTARRDPDEVAAASGASWRSSRTTAGSSAIIPGKRREYQLRRAWAARLDPHLWKDLAPLPDYPAE